MKSIMDLVPVAIAFGAAGIVVGIVADVLTDISDGQNAGTGKDATLNATAGVGELASYLPTIGTVAALGIVITVLLGIFMRGRR